MGKQITARYFVQQQNASGPQQRFRVTQCRTDVSGRMQNIRCDDHIVAAGRIPLLLNAALGIKNAAS
ncbi:hypothetical protein D3C75_1281120 [compost metagenome]